MAKCVWMFYSTSRLSLHYRMNLMKNAPRLQVNNYTPHTGRHDRQPEGQSNRMDPAGTGGKGSVWSCEWSERVESQQPLTDSMKILGGRVSESSFSNDPLIDDCLGWRLQGNSTIKMTRRVNITTNKCCYQRIMLWLTVMAMRERTTAKGDLGVVVFQSKVWSSVLSDNNPS